MNAILNVAEASERPAAVNDSGQPATERDSQVELSREALAFMAGYVVYKCRDLDASLGYQTSNPPPAGSVAVSVPSGWTEAISRGHLYLPTDWWMAVVEEFETNFCLLMGSTADQEPGILRRLVELISQKQPGLHPRVARKLASTRLHVRLKKLNEARDQAKDARRAGKKVEQHVQSAKT